MIKDIMEEIERSAPSSLAARLDRTRPYNGQAHTGEGERGRQEVSGVTMRDIDDCLMRAFYASSGLSPRDWPGNVYDLPWEDMDPVAIIQNLGCEIEKAMGIYPNVPRPVPVDPTEKHWCGPDIVSAVYTSHEGECT